MKHIGTILLALAAIFGLITAILTYSVGQTASTVGFVGLSLLLVVLSVIEAQVAQN